MATGSQLTVYANRAQRKGHQPVVEWILEAAKAAGVAGATVVEGAEGIDARGRVHAARFVELADEPAAVIVVADDAQIDVLVAALAQGGVKLFYTRVAVEFERLGDTG